MKIDNIKNFVRGWFIGDFSPSIYSTKEFEIGIMRHKQGEHWPCHYHTGMEITYIISGQMLIHNKKLETGDVFIIHPFEISDPVFLTDCHILAIKVPSNTQDKYLADRPEYET